MSYQHCNVHDEDATNGCMSCAAEHETRAREYIARRFHEQYEKLAPDCGYETRHNTRVAYKDLPIELTTLVCAVVESLLEEGTIVIGDNAIDATEG